MINYDVLDLCNYILDNGHEEENYIDHCRENNMSALAFKDSEHIFTKALIVKNDGNILKAIVEFLGGYSLTMDDITNLSGSNTLDSRFLTGCLLISEALHREITDFLLDNITMDDLDEGTELSKIVSKLGIDSYLEEEIRKGWAE